jgi:hypothetical protein
MCMNEKTYYWQVCSHDKFSREDAEEMTKRKNPGHEIQGFKVTDSKILDGYHTTTWISRLIEQEDL